MPEEFIYHFTIPIIMPGHSKAITCSLDVKAADHTSAVEAMQREWNKQTQVTEYAVKEMPVAARPAGKIQEA